MSKFSKGVTFGDTAPDNSVTSTRLNDLVDEAEALPGLITEQTDIGSAIASDDVLMLYDTSASLLKKCEVQNFLVPQHISGKTDLSTAIATDDVFLVSDTSASGGLKKVQAANVLPPEALTAKTALTTTALDDLLLISDTSASAALKKVTLDNLIPTFTSTVTALNGLAAGTSLSEAHGLAAVPREVLGVIVCTGTELGYAVADEVPFYLVTSSTGIPAMAACANATNVFVVQLASSALYIRHKTTAAYTSLDATKWSLKVIARR